MIRNILICTLLLGAASASAQHKLVRSVFGNAGAGTASTGFSIRGTTGQGAIDSSSSTANTVQSGFWHGVAGIVTSIGALDGLPLPTVFRLEQNYPNPFNPSTTIRFALPKASPVVITLYDVLGRRIKRLINDDYGPGVYELNFDASELPSGVYLYQIRAGTFQQMKKLMLLK